MATNLKATNLKATNLIRNRKTDTSPRTKQQQHWERIGQIHRMIGLINYQFTNHGDKIPREVSIALDRARTQLRTALIYEGRNNEFINLKKKVSWK